MKESAWCPSCGEPGRKMWDGEHCLRCQYNRLKAIHTKKTRTTPTSLANERTFIDE